MNKLEFGIEIIAAMKASCRDWNIETGRALALENTEPNLVEDIDFEKCDDEQKEMCVIVAKVEKEKLHKQALYVADIALDYLGRAKADGNSQPANCAIFDVSGSLPLTKDHMCFDKGHAYFVVTTIDNGSSRYGHYKCGRCGHEESYQYDYA